MNYIIACALMLSCFGTLNAQTERYPELVDSLLSSQWKAADMVMGSYESAMTDQTINKSGRMFLKYYTDANRRVLYKAIRRDSLNGMTRFYMLYFVKNSFVKSESWIWADNQVRDYTVSYYENEKLVFPSQRDAGGKPRESLNYLANEFLTIFVNYRKPSR